MTEERDTQRHLNISNERHKKIKGHTLVIANEQTMEKRAEDLMVKGEKYEKAQERGK